MKFFGIAEREGEMNSDTELTLREFFLNKFKILRVDEEQIHFDRVYTVVVSSIFFSNFSSKLNV